MSVLQKHKGALAELRAAAWLLDQGYEVFRNVSAHGPADIVGFRDGKFERFDVKTALRCAVDGVGGRRIIPQHEIKVIVYFPETQACAIPPARMPPAE